jgi:hypothetical protein
MRRCFYYLPAIPCLAALISFPVGALSWKQTTTNSGIPISWDGSCFYYSINNLGSDNFSFKELEQITRSSFDVWENVECSYFSFPETEPASVDEAAFHLDSPKNVGSLKHVFLPFRSPVFRPLDALNGALNGVRLTFRY